MLDLHQLNSLAYYYEGSGDEANEETKSSIILATSLLTARHIPVAGEYEVKNVVAMKVMDALGAGGSLRSTTRLTSPTTSFSWGMMDPGT